jgi:hypothetical protein
MRRSLSFTRVSSITTVASRTTEEVNGFEKVLGESGVAEYGHEEEKYLNNPELRTGELNSDGEEIQEDPSSGDNDELEYLFEDEDDEGAEYGSDECPESLYICGTDAVSDIRGSASSGKIAFNFRKVKWFDTVTATDRATARQYIKKEISTLKKRDVQALTNHLKKLQRREKRRIEIENGKRGRLGSLSESLHLDEDDDETLHQPSSSGKLPSPMTPSLSAALVLESLSINPLESLEGMAKCYEGIVAAGSALLDTGEKKKHSKEEIMNALAPLLITTLEKASGDTIIALAKLRKSCGTKRYQRRFVQRIAPSLVRPPNASMWCLRHQQEMESILAATELILDKSFDIFHKEWYGHGRTILADSKRAETLKAAATQLKILSAYKPSDRLMKGLSSKTGAHHRNGSFLKPSTDHSGSGTEVMAEWEILAVDQQIRDSIHNLFSKDWNRVVLSNVPPRDGEPQSKRLKGISAGKSKLSSITDNDGSSVSSNEQSHYAASPPRLSHSNRILTSTNSTSYSSNNGPKSSQSPQESSPVFARTKDVKGNQRSELYDSTTPPQTPRNNENEIPSTPPRSPPHAPSYNLSPRTNPISPSNETSKSPAPLSPVNSYRRQQEASHQRFTSATTGVSPNAQSKYLRTLTSTAAERKRTVAACRALRAQISRFEEAFIKMHGRPPKGAGERAPLATTYAQYREWKRAIRADAASRIQALSRGARVRSYLSHNPMIRDIVRRRAGRPKKISHLVLPVNLENSRRTSVQTQSIAPIPRRDDGSVEIVMGQSSAWSRRSMGDVSHESSSINSGQFTRQSGVSVSTAVRQELAHLSLPELQTLKRELKQELKRYDMEFYNQHGRMPIKTEKEPIRHLYEKYNQLKNRMTAVERDPSLIQQSIPGPRRQQQPVSVPIPNKSSSSNENSTNNNSQSNAHRIQGQNNARTDTYGKQTTSSGSSATQDLGALKTEKQSLHQMLRQYEKEFFKRYNRQVSSYADIRPVAGQYRRYKEIKKSIQALQSTGDK